MRESIKKKHRQKGLLAVPCVRTNHKIYNETHLNKEEGKRGCTGLSEGNVAEESVGRACLLFRGSSMHAYRGLHMYRLCGHIAHAHRLLGA